MDLSCADLEEMDEIRDTCNGDEIRTNIYTTMFYNISSQKYNKYYKVITTKSKPNIHTSAVHFVLHHQLRCW